MTWFAIGSDAPVAFGKDFKAHGVHDLCDPLVIRWGTIVVFFQARRDSLCTIKALFIIEDGLDSGSDKRIRADPCPSRFASSDPLVERRTIELENVTHPCEPSTRFGGHRQTGNGSPACLFGKIFRGLAQDVTLFAQL